MQEVTFKLGIDFLKVLRTIISWRIVPILVVTTERISIFFPAKLTLLRQN